MTSLRECKNCGLRFRLPKEKPGATARFYQDEYRAGFTTDLPDDDELSQLLAHAFQGTPKDFSSYITVLGALGLGAGDTILDFGSSWGYGSWQLRQAGFKVYSHEISLPRAKYAAEKLGCQVINDLSEIPKEVICFFCAHVIEHLPDPNDIWKAAKATLAPGGILVCFMPNGEPGLERVYGSKRYHRLWGQVHPLLLNRNALKFMAERYGYESHFYSPPYCMTDLKKMRSHKELLGGEILMVAFDRT